ncbi:MAG: hypothetical protein FVQ79_12205 [Planctomycetes bacterium]|nr:hypothetical protein [Planctomycetota bacterium]
MGELNEDAEILFAEYLTEHCEATEWAREILADYEMTASVVEAKTKEVRANMVFAGKPNILLRQGWQPIAKWAAVVIFASMIGIGFGRWSKEVKYYSRTSYEKTERNVPAKRSVATVLNEKTGFWGKKAAAFLEPSKFPKRKPSVKSSNLWDNYRKLKERRRE